MDKEINRRIVNYITLARQKYAGIESAYLFGSFAKGNSNRESDIDLALIFKDLEDVKRLDVQVQLILLASQIDSRIEPHPISYDDFYSGDPFAIEIQRTGFMISA